MKATSVLLGLLGLAGYATGDPTWPSEVDELEEIMFQLTSFRARKFADTVSPCTNEASGPGRQNAAEWLRTAFHDMSTANTYFGLGGLDASLQYELTNGENTGPGHTTTLEFMAPFMSRKASLSDLIAMGVYMSVRSCGGPAVPIRAGRIDATESGATGVPQPQNSVLTFEQQFDRMGFTVEEMIQVTACGHTLGGVHDEEFPDLVSVGSTEDGEAPLDTSDAVFDNKVVTEYLDGTTLNPLVVGPSVKISKNSDFKVFNSDSNVTMEALVDTTTFTSVCKTVLQKMIDVVPPAVVLTDPIVPFTVKPVNLQLTLANGGTTLLFSGFIRLRTTDVPVDSIDSVTIKYKNREGGTTCGSGACTITSTVQGASQGFDDTFAFFPIEANIPVATGISSFTVTVNHADGTTEDYDNNGNEYPMQDAVLLQLPQSCLLPSTGALTLVAAVRNDVVSDGAQAFISYKVPQTGSPVPLLQNATIDLEKGDCIGEYTFFTTDYSVEGGLAYESYIDVINGDNSDSFVAAAQIGGTCRTFTNPAACNGEPPSTTSSDSDVSSTTTAVESPTESSVTPTDSASSTVSTTSATTTTASLHHRETLGGYLLVSCWTEGEGVRALAAATFVDDEMTLEGCMEHCSDYVYWGTEYGRECYCGNSLAGSSKKAPLDDCNMACGGDASEYCGAGNRIELYSTTAAQPSVSPSSTSAIPTGTPSHEAKVGDYGLVGCWTEGDGARALDGLATASDEMTLESCAEFCSGFVYFGTEYGRECYCGNTLDSTSNSAATDDCSMMCAGDRLEYCGAGNRLELYKLGGAPTGTPSSAPATTTSKSTSDDPSTAVTTVTSTLGHVPTVSPYTMVGCWAEASGGRALGQDSTTNAKMTNELCAEFCDGYKYFGTEYGDECYCASFLNEESASAPLDDCSMPCKGNPYEYCGAGNRLELYMNPDAAGGDPEQPAAAGDFVWLGCQTEAAGVRTLDGSSTATDDMTNEVCADFCEGYKYFGTEYGRECYCGNALAEESETAPASQCKMICSGSELEYCGGSGRLSVYVVKEDPPV